MIERLIKLIYPPRCVFCNSIIVQSSKLEICDNCYSKLHFIKNTLNLQGEPFASNKFCSDIVCLFEYTGIVRQSILKYKFYNKQSFYRTFGKLLSICVKEVTNNRNFDIIISVPLHKDKLKSRGYNQSQLISNVISKELGVLVFSDLLVKVKNTSSQSLLRREERKLNIKGAFELRRTDLIRDKSVLLVDDILTTGSTILECSRILTEAGAKEITAAVLASGKKYN